MLHVVLQLAPRLKQQLASELNDDVLHDPRSCALFIYLFVYLFIYWPKLTHVT